MTRKNLSELHDLDRSRFDDCLLQAIAVVYRAFRINGAGVTLVLGDRKGDDPASVAVVSDYPDSAVALHLGRALEQKTCNPGPNYFPEEFATHPALIERARAIGNLDDHPPVYSPTMDPMSERDRAIAAIVRATNALIDSVMAASIDMPKEQGELVRRSTKEARDAVAFAAMKFGIDGRAR